MSNLEFTPKKKCALKNAPSAPKKSRIDYGLDLSPSPLGFDLSVDPFTDTQPFFMETQPLMETQPFMETQAKVPDYYKKQRCQGAPFKDGLNYDGYEQKLYPSYEPSTPKPNAPTSRILFPTTTEPASKRKVVRKREDVVKQRNLQRFSVAFFCDKCDANSGFDGAMVKIRLCRQCLTKVGTNVM